jgi:hypothetical protein
VFAIPQRMDGILHRREPGVAGRKSKESCTIASEPVTTGIFAPQLTSWKCKYPVAYIVPVPSVSVAETATRVLTDQRCDRLGRGNGNKSLILSNQR